MTVSQPKRRWFQFSLRTLLLFMVVASVGLSWVAIRVQQVKRHKEATEAIGNVGGSVTWRTTYHPWLVNVLGEEFCFTNTKVEFYGSYFYSQEKSNAGLERLKDLPALRILDLSKRQVTDAGLEQLQELSQLRSLFLGRCRVTDAGLEHLGGFRRLDHLELSGTQITDAGLKHLDGLSQLLMLFVDSTQVTEEGVKKLLQALPSCQIRQ